jgi:hypothetical protein
MARVTITHGVGNMDVWLKGGADRERLFAPFCSSYRIFKHMDSNRVAIVSEGVDLAKMQAAMSSPEVEAGKKAHTVLEPLDVYIEIEGGK